MSINFLKLLPEGKLGWLGFAVLAGGLLGAVAWLPIAITDADMAARRQGLPGPAPGFFIGALVLQPALGAAILYVVRHLPRTGFFYLALRLLVLGLLGWALLFWLMWVVASVFFSGLGPNPGGMYG